MSSLPIALFVIFLTDWFFPGILEKENAMVASLFV